MENQHRQIKGYRELNKDEIDAMNKVKTQGVIIGDLVDELRVTPGIDQRWLAIGVTDLQKGLMSITRAIAKPSFF